MDRSKQDRQSQRTQQMLIDALLSLLAVKNYDEISINDIVAMANVGRSTFYVHFLSKDDLLKRGFERILDHLIQQICLDQTDQNLRLDTTLLFSHAQGHYELYRTLIWGSGFEILTRDGHTALALKLNNSITSLMAGKPPPAIPIKILSYTMAGTLLILLKWWLDHKMPYPPETMNEIFQQMVMTSIRNIVGTV